MKTRNLVLALVVLCTVSSMSFAGIINPISATVSMTGTADAGCGAVTTSQTNSWGTPLSSLSATVSTLASCTRPNRNVTAQGTVTANWANSTKKGNVKFSNVGWKANNNVTAGSADLGAGVDYTYTFQPTTQITLVLTYTSSYTGDLGGFGLNGFLVQLTGNWNAALPLGTSGSLVAVLYPANVYTLTIENLANIRGGIGGVKELMDGRFDFDAYATPEPSSLMLLGSGIVGVAGLLRRRMK